MDMDDIVIDPDMPFPVLFIPKKFTTLETNCEFSDNVYIDVTITSPDADGKNTSIYSGYCNVKLMGSNNIDSNRDEIPESPTTPEINEMPVILSEENQYPSYSQSQVWIDPSKSPYVYNHYEPSTQEQYSIREAGGLITVEQHNTYITQNVYNCKESNVFNNKEPQSTKTDTVQEGKRYRKAATSSDSNFSYYKEDEFECGVFLSQLPEEILNGKHTIARGERNFSRQQENNAVKQLMSSDIQSTSKQRKTILFLGNDSRSGHTLQNISYNDPLLKCAEIEVDHEVVISTSSPDLKKKYQCDKCKQIFNQISSFRQHMVGSHTNFKVSAKPSKESSFVCSECGKKLKTLKKFELHCLGHGDPDLECPKCCKVFASKFSLRVHMKIHSRKYSCNFCVKSYSSFQEMRSHVEKIHTVFMCEEEDCTFVGEKASDLVEHPHWRKTEVEDIEIIDTDFKGVDIMDDTDDPEENELKSEVKQLDQDLMSSRQLVQSNPDLSRSSDDFMRSAQDLATSNQDLAMSNQDLSTSNQDLAMSNQDLSTSYQDLAMSNQDLSTSNKNLAMSNQDIKMSNRELSTSNDNLAMSNQDLAMSNPDLSTSNQNMAMSNQDLKTSNQDLSAFNHDLAFSNQDLSTSYQNLAMSNQDLKVSNQDLSTSNQNLAMSNLDLKMPNQDMTTSNKNLSMPNQDLAMSNQDLAMSNQDLAMSNQDLAMSNQDLAMSNQDLAMSNQDLAMSNQDLSTSNQNQNRSISNPDFTMTNQDSSTSIQNLAGSSKDFLKTGRNLRSNQDQSSSSPVLRSSRNLESNQDRSRSSLSLARSHESLTVQETDGEKIRNADSVIAKVMSNTIFFMTAKNARRHQFRRTCEVCLKSFNRIDDLKRHLIEHVIRSTLAKTPVSRSGCLKITCEVCQTHTFSKVDKYKSHLREHAKLTIYRCTFCDKSFSDSSNFSKHKKIHGHAYLQCDLCHRKFNSKKMITSHMEYHRTHPPMNCIYCMKIFHFASSLNKHMRCAHKKGDLTKYRCRFCVEIFRSLKEKWEHEWRAHSVRKMIVDCVICGAQYRKYSELKRHCFDEHEMNLPPVRKFLKKGFIKKISFD